MDRHTSTLGNVCYYDMKLYKPQLCDPSLLFLLGLEHILTDVETYNLDDYSQYIHFNRENIPEVFNKVYYYFYGKQPKDNVNEIKYNCNKLKLFLNTLFGDTNNPIVPIIYHWNLEPTINIEQNIDSFIKTFTYAGYCKNDINVHYFGKFGITNEHTLLYIDELNKQIKNEHNEKKHYANLYKQLDIKAMYSYALGVLYGCTCLGYDSNLVFRVDPSHWYDGENSNLIRTAYAVFKYHHYHDLCCIDIDRKLKRKYHGIQCNRLWDLSDSGIDVSDISYYCSAINHDESVKENIICFDSDTFIKYDSETGEWSDKIDVSELLNNGYGIIDLDTLAEWYFGPNSVEVYSTLKSSKKSYLSPDKKSHYTDVANIGWFNLNKRKSALSISPVSFPDLPQDRFGNAISKASGAITGYYTADIDTDISLFGIMSGKIDTYEDDMLDFTDVEELFVELISSAEFNDNYYTEIPEGYTVLNYYDLDQPIALCISDENPEYYYNGEEEIPLVEKGYTLTPSVALDAHVYDYENNVVVPFDLRVNDDLDAYWSAEWDPKEWTDSFDDSILIKSGEIVSLYRNTECLFDNEPTYISKRYISKVICNTMQTSYDLQFGILKIDDLYNLGITPYECEIVETDPNGDPLVDEYGNFVVWYDANKSKYWNGYVNAWQDSVPVRNNTTMYDTLTHTASGISDNEADHEITLYDGTVISYEEFYASPYYHGVIRDSVSFKLFNQSISDSVLQCYYDDKFGDGGRYCVPDVFDHWMTFNEVHENNYRFVNGESTLYDGDSLVPVIVDDDPSD